MGKTKNILLLGLASVVSFASIAADKGILISDNTKSIDFVSSVNKETTPDSTLIEVEQAQLTVGTKVFKRDDGTCYKETSTVENVHTVKSSVQGKTIDLPVTSFKRENVSCS